MKRMLGVFALAIATSVGCDRTQEGVGEDVAEPAPAQPKTPPKPEPKAEPEPKPEPEPGPAEDVADAEQDVLRSGLGDGLDEGTKALGKGAQALKGEAGELIGALADAADRPPSEPEQPEPEKPEPKKPEPKKPEPKKPEPQKPEPKKPEPKQDPDPPRSDPKPLPDKPKPVKPKPSGKKLARLKGGQVKMKQKVRFKFGKATLDESSMPLMDDVAVVMLRSGKSFCVTGHSDSKGSARYNLKLSQTRARSVERALEQRTVPSAKVGSLGCGEDAPLASNETPEGRAKNRRIEIRTGECACVGKK